MTHQLLANYGMIDQAGADIGSHAGNIDAYKAQLKAEAARALGNFGGGVGTEQHNAAMREVDRLVDEHVQNVRQHQTSTSNAGQTFQGAGRRMQGILGSGA